MVEDDKNKKNNKNSKGNKRKFHEKKNDSNKKSKMACWKCGKPGHFKKDCRVKKNNGVSTSGSGQGSKDPSPQQGLISDHVIIPVKNYVSHIYEICYVQDDEIAWWIDSGATCHACKDRCWFDTFHPVEDGSVLHMGDESTKPILGHRGGEYYDPSYFQSVGIIHQTTAPYTPQQNGVSERKNRALKEMVNSMLSYSGLSEGFWGEAMLTACYLLNRVPNKNNKITPYELWFYVIEPNDFVSVNSVIESRDAIFDENRFSSIPRPKDIVSSSNGTQGGDLPGETPTGIPEPRRSNRARVAKSYGSDFQLYLVQGSRDEITSQYSNVTV
ncbi:zinc finger, CCHC-type containing protein [Tanacetum coccineum]